MIEGADAAGAEEGIEAAEDAVGAGADVRVGPKVTAWPAEETVGIWSAPEAGSWASASSGQTVLSTQPLRSSSSGVFGSYLGAVDDVGEDAVESSDGPVVAPPPDSDGMPEKSLFPVLGFLGGSNVNGFRPANLSAGWCSPIEDRLPIIIRLKEL